MPRPIKKKPEKKPRIEDEGMNYVESIRDAYEKNQKIIQKAVLVLVVIIIAGAAVFFYVKKTRAKLAELNYQGYKAYSEALATSDNDKMNEALEKFRESYKVKKSAYSLYYQADILIRAGDTEAALKALNDLIKGYPSDDVILPMAYAKLGTLYLSQNDNENALKTFRDMESRNIPVYGDLALYYQSKVLKSMGKADEAGQAMQTLVEKFPDSPYAMEVKPQLESEKKKETEGNEKEKKTGDNKEKKEK